jgi:hypothetical protein
MISTVKHVETYIEKMCSGWLPPCATYSVVYLTPLQILCSACQDDMPQCSGWHAGHRNLITAPINGTRVTMTPDINVPTVRGVADFPELALAITLIGLC